MGSVNDKTLLVAIDGSEHAWKALDLACDIAKPGNSPLIILHVVIDPTLSEDLHRYADADSIRGEREYLFYELIVDKLLSEAGKRARRNGIENILTLSSKGSPAERILAMAELHNVDLIVMGSRGLSNIKGLLIGSVSHTVVQLAPCSCITVK